MQLTIPEFALIVLVGPAGAGKSTFARKHFKATEILSSDFFRGLVADDESDQAATRDAFEVLHYIAAKRLRAGRLTVIDATSVRPEARQPLLSLARQFHSPAVALVFNLPEELCQQRNRQRSGRRVEAAVVHLQHEQLQQALTALPREGFAQVHVFSRQEEIDAVEMSRRPPPDIDKRQEHGPFDLIGDVHGCFDELLALLGSLGYTFQSGAGTAELLVRPPEGRKAIFVGDLVDRGPKIPAVLRLVMHMVAASTALCVAGNHDDKLLRKLKGRDLRVSSGMAASLAQLAAEPPEFTGQVRAFLDRLPTHVLLDEGKLVVAHAGLKEELQGGSSAQVRSFALFGDTTGENDAYGLPVRRDWAANYRGRARVVYGHTPVAEPVWVNGTINIDTGCVFGGRLTALRYPELVLVSVPAARQYSYPPKPFLPVPGAEREDPLAESSRTPPTP
jgi:protein phosphatase